MVRINDGYVVKVDELNYTAMVDCHRVDKDGEPVYKTVGYYGSLKQAIEGVFKHQGKIALSEGEKSLHEAIRILDGIEKDFEKTLDVVKG